MRVHVAVVLAALLVGPAAAFERTEEREPCVGVSDLRQPFFGDLHVHTALSLDAATQLTRLRPRDAYRFARGEEMGIQPYDEKGVPLRRVKLDRPLDFAVVTDHSELFGELHVCENPGLPGHDSPACMIYRRWPRLAFFILNGRVSEGPGATRFSYCGEGGTGCLEAARVPWREIQDAAEEAYDRTSACRFTTFVGYEWTGAPDSRNLHRNVIFRNDAVPPLPISALDATVASELWRELKSQCKAGLDGCDVLAIPHNSNLSGGLMFQDREETDVPFTSSYAALRAESEPLVEVLQHKGSSECRTGVATEDELCAFEQLPYDRFGGKYTATMQHAPGPTNFVRSALGSGLLLEERLGTNPFKLGMVASTDTHLGASGYVDEKNHVGHGGAGAPMVREITPGLPDDIEFNPGGLAVLWAEENSRDSLFEAMRRRETYATSGPRMTVRFFGGWSYSADLCQRSDLAARGYAEGVPMGGDLPVAPASSRSPRFVAWALRDPGTANRPSVPLQRIQIIKGWVENGQMLEKIYEVAGNPRSEASVDPATCAPRGTGADDLCAVWTDPDFDPLHRAFYYARVLENPSCRWQSWICLAQGVRCDDPVTVPGSLEACCDPRYPRTIQERSITSPIWYTPAGS
jgi:hypothetical protein